MGANAKSFTMRINLPPAGSMGADGKLAKATPVSRGVPHAAVDNSLYHGLLQNLYDAALITDLKGNITSANIRALDFLLYERGELCTMQITQIISGADDSLLQVIMQNLGNQRFTHIEGYCVRKDGAIFPSEIVANRIQAGDFDQLCFFIRDITQRKLVEEQLSRTEERHLALLNAMPDLMLRISKDGELLDFKPSARESPMVPPPGAVGRKISELYPLVAEGFMEHVERALVGKTEVFEYQLPSANDLRYYEARFVVNDVEQVLAIVRDITARKSAEKAEKERLERDLEIARDIQRHLLPESYPDNLEGIEIRAINIAAMKVGGDYYDFIQVDKDHIGLAIADVSGKGISGALVMAMCRSALRTKAPGNLSPMSVLREVNRVIRPDMREDMFISMIYSVMNIHTRELVFCRAGHEPLLIHRSTSGSEFLSPKGMALGIDGGAVFDNVLTEQRVKLNKGDTLILYTDGITEALNEEGQEFGRDALLKSISTNSKGDASELVTSLEHDILEFVGKAPQNDDITLMVVRA